jgi:hypothetical protein
MKRQCVVLLGISALLIGVPAAAHHSFVMFDNNKAQTLVGTVKELQWTNPHCFIQLLVPMGSSTTEWSIEMGSTAALYRLGWRPSAIAAGDKITVVIHPMRDGTAGGSFVSAVAPDGRPIGSHT